MSRRIGIVVTHPIQYYAPWYRALSTLLDLEVIYCHRQQAADQARSEFGVAFEWDIPLLEGYRSTFLENRARTPNVSTFSGCDTPQIAALVRERCYDALIVQGWYTKSYLQAITAGWRNGIPVLVRGDSHLLTPRSKAKHLLKAVIYRAFIPRFAGYLVVGRRNRDYYLHYGAKPQRMFFAPHAVDNQFFDAQARTLRSQRASLRAQWGIPQDAIVALFAGKLALHKRPFDFIYALEQVNADKPVFGVIVGDGQLHGELQAYVEQHDLPARLLGFYNQSRMPEAYVMADLLVVPSHETWGLVVNEAMASGLPAIVSTAVGCAPDLVNDGETGATFAHGDVDQLARLLEQFAADPQRLRQMGRQARRHIERYAISVTVQGTLEALKNLRI